ncbi:uncharacterized protein [Bombus fervidus]|uniref:uncharacterized protein n=1 Tax=Bombus fervidus TaxID=203811 RepID=UPI003AB8877F
MSNDNDYVLILDRINFPEKRFLDRSGYTYMCGKVKENDIVCRSTKASNRHCTFFHNENEVYVTDLKSAHGTFVNGVRLQPFQTIKLHLNDVIGIGYSTVANLITNNDIYAYKLRAFQLLYREDDKSVSAPLGTNSSMKKETANYKTVGDKVYKLKQNHSNSGFESQSKILKFQGQKCVSEQNNFSKMLNTIQGKDKEKSKTHDKLNAERRIDMNTPTCSTNCSDKSARFPKSKEDCRKESLKKSEKLSKPRLSGEKKTERQGKLKSGKHLHAKEQKNQVPRKCADSLPLNAMLLNILSTEVLETLRNDIMMKLKKIEEQKAASLANNREERRIFPKTKVNITTKSGNDIHLGQTIAGSGKKIATEVPTASSSRFAAADNTCSNAKATDPIKSENVSKEMATNLYHSLHDILLDLKRLYDL